MENQATEPRQALCKFYCDSVTLHPSGQQTVCLRAMYDPDLPEDGRFSTATPSGEMKFAVNNPALSGFFQPGKYYFIALTPVP